ncbi:hypothetical protein Tco_0408508 [Tanacetum coccineum]
MGRPKPRADIEIGINVGPRLSEEGRLKRRSKKCNTTRGEPKACAKEEANQSEWRQGGEKRKIEQFKGERSCPFFSGNPPPHMSKRRERGRKNNHLNLAHEVAGLARTNADLEEWVWDFKKDEYAKDGDSRTGKSGTRHLLNKTKNKAIPCPWEKLVMIAMNAALEEVYKKEEFQPLFPMGRVSLLSELAGREDQLINMNLKSGWLIAASLSWRLSGWGGACYRNLFPGDIKCGKFLVGFSSSLSNRGKEDLHLFHSFSARGEARPTTNEGGKLALLAVALFLGLLRQKLQRGGGAWPGKGRVVEWSKVVDYKSVEVFLCRFKSYLSHLFVVDFRKEKRGIRQRRKANRTKLLWPFREVQLYRMLVREVGKLLRSIDSPSISNPNEKRNE